MLGRHARQLLSIVVLVGLSSLPAGLDAQADFAGVEAVAMKEMAQAIAIVQDDRVVYTRAFGIANVETSEETR